MIRSLDDLSPATAQAARRWLDASVAHLPPEYRGVVRDDMLGSMYAAVEPDMTPEAFATAVDVRSYSRTSGHTSLESVTRSSGSAALSSSRTRRSCAGLT